MDTTFFTAEDFREVTSHKLTDVLNTDNGVMWADLEQPIEADFAKLRAVFSFHPLAIEDTLHQNQRPKVEEYQDHLFIVLKPSSILANTVSFRELEVFVGRNYLITIHYSDEPVIKHARKRLDLHQERTSFSSSATQFLYTLLDVVIDGYIQALDQLEDEVEILSKEVLVAPTPDTLNRLFELKSVFSNMSRILLPQREIINVLVNHNVVFINPNSQYYLRDVSDHLAQAIDRVRLGQDNLNTLMSLYASAVSNQLNQHVNRLTILAIVLGVFTIFTGFYGMNFEHTWPQWSEPLAIPSMLIVITFVIGLFLAILRWRKWY
jgi:magnesium transporter